PDGAVVTADGRGPLRRAGPGRPGRPEPSGRRPVDVLGPGPPRRLRGPGRDLRRRRLRLGRPGPPAGRGLQRPPRRRAPPPPPPPPTARSPAARAAPTATASSTPPPPPPAPSSRAPANPTGVPQPGYSGGRTPESPQPEAPPNRRSSARI